ncbi:MAG: GNAT family N-acetyltransferase [Mogibacterium sp.]|nr:GNAT family N-acetyltransferase [Mogibacterium sp.]
MNVPIDITEVVLKTERLILRPWRLSDLEDFYDYAKVKGVGEMAGWKPHESIKESREILEMFANDKKTFAVVYNGKAIGSVGIEEYSEDKFPEFSELKCREIGYVLSKDHWGKGLMPEAILEVIRYLFEEVGLDLIVCGHFIWNTQSDRVQEKCGFRHYGFSKYETRINTIEDSEDKILTREMWEQKSGGCN